MSLLCVVNISSNECPVNVLSKGHLKRSLAVSVKRETETKQIFANSLFLSQSIENRPASLLQKVECQAHSDSLQDHCFIILCP